MEQKGYPKKVFILPPIPKPEGDPTEPSKLRAAAYCRVSSRSEDQLSSYELQIQYFEQYIKSQPEYCFMGVYADEGISGTGLKKREAFQKMMRDAKAGKLDLIITKSVSRFGRNTLDSLRAIRELKELQVDVYFEKEGIHTKDSEGEVLLTLILAVAESESINQSENVKWGLQRKYEQGLISSVPCGKFLGYEKRDGTLWIKEHQAEIVKRIYREFLDGYGTYQIAERLTAERIPMAYGGKGWCPTHIKNVLQNEKYKGDTLFRKTFHADPLTKKTIKNNGIQNQYYCENTHPAIIDQETWACVKLEFERQKQYCDQHQVRTVKNNSFPGTLSGKLVCGTCGRTFMQLLKQGRRYWRCKSFAGCHGTPIEGVSFTPKPMARWSKQPDSPAARYREKHRKLPQARQMLCTDVEIAAGRPEQAFVQAWNTLVNHPELAKIMELDDTLVRYRKREAARLIQEYGFIEEMPKELMLKTLDCIEVCPDGKLKVAFLIGACIPVDAVEKPYEELASKINK